MTDRPAPLTPADADLQDFPFMPLHVARLRDSNLAAEETAEACWYALLLWSASWHQLPAGSLPDNDAVLTRLIGLGRDVKTFRKHRAGAVRGMVCCADGRLYHPVVAEQVNAGWRRKIEQRWRAECARVKKANQRNATDHPAPTLDEFIDRLPATSRPLDAGYFVPEDTAPCPEGQQLASLETEGACPQGNDIQERETGTETGTGRLKELRKRSSGAAASPEESAAFDGFWAVYPLRKGKAPAKEAFLRILRTEVATIDKIMAGTRAYAGERAGKDPTKTKFAQGWLNDQRWEDEAPPGGTPRPRALGPAVW